MTSFFTLQYSTPSQGPFKVFGCKAKSKEHFLELFYQRAGSLDSTQVERQYFYDYEDYAQGFEEPLSFVQYMTESVVGNDSDCPHSIFEWNLQ